MLRGPSSTVRLVVEGRATDGLDGPLDRRRPRPEEPSERDRHLRSPATMRSREVEIRRATEADEAGILTLARRALGWTDDPRFIELFRWKHDRNPFGASPRWVAVDRDRIVGFRTFLRWRFRR